MKLAFRDFWNSSFEEIDKFMSELGFVSFISVETIVLPSNDPNIPNSEKIRIWYWLE